MRYLKKCALAFLLGWVFLLMNFPELSAQEDRLPIKNEINLDDLQAGIIHRIWLQLGIDSYSRPLVVPVMIAKGTEDGPVLGLTAAIHGNELNGIPVIQEVFANLEVKELQGTLIGIPGLNPWGLVNHRRRYIDEEDLNRNFPGNENGNRSQQITRRIGERIIGNLDFHLDMHTASFGRINSLYTRGDIEDDTLFTMLKLQNPDLILANKGQPSFGSKTATSMRALAISKGVKSITVEYGNPQVYQEDIIQRGILGVKNLMRWLGMLNGPVSISEKVTICKNSYWIYTHQGGLLEIEVALNQKLVKGQRIGVLRNPFGDRLEEYHAPEAGIVIGMSTNPANISGGRVIHLGILDERYE